MPLDMSTLMPGMNPSGTSQAVPGVGSSSTPAMGGASNPFLPSFPGGGAMPGMTNPMGSTGPDANMGGGVSMNGMPGMATTNTMGGGNDPISQWLAQITGQGFGANGVAPGSNNFGGAQGGGGTGAGGIGNSFAQSLGLGAGDPNAAHNFVKAMRKAGYSSGVAGQLWNFINSGAGFNQDIVNQLFAGMQPQIQRGEENILEQFGAMGLGMSSPAAIGTGDFLSQVNLNMGNIEAAMMEQATQNYLTVLMGGKGQPPQSMFQNINQLLQTLAQSQKAAAGIAGLG